MLKDFIVHPVLNGYVVKIGCQSMVFTSISELTSIISAYLTNPKEVEEAVLKTALNAKYLMPKVYDTCASQATQSLLPRLRVDPEECDISPGRI